MTANRSNLFLGLNSVDQCKTPKTDIPCLKGHSHLCDRADLDTSFVNFEKRPPQPEIKSTRRTYLNPLQSSQCFIGFSIFYWEPVSEYAFAHPMVLSYGIILAISFFLRIPISFDKPHF